jgi:subtilase family serine protease
MVAAVALIPVASSSVAASSISRMSVDPIISPAGSLTPGYGLLSCQNGTSSIPGRVCYDPYQMRNAYGVSPLIAAGDTGAGKTIIILDAFQSPNIVQELNTFDSLYGLPGLNGLGNPTDPSLGTFTQIAPDGLTPFVPANPNMTGWAEEITLDVLWSHAIAPGANIVLDLSTDNSDVALQSALKYAVDNNLGDVVSQSFGENETCLDTATTNTWHSIYASAIMKGMTVFASSGDQGAAQRTCDGKSWTRVVSSPASDPLITAVGGTELHAAGYPSSCHATTDTGCGSGLTPTPGTHEGEIAWNEGPPYGDFQPYFGSTEASGGGFSSVWREPSYQQGTIHGGKQRAVPDVSYNAAVLGSGVITYLNIPGGPVGIYTFGGTSAGSPQWAAITAIADQKAGHDLGFINTALYHIAQARPHYTAGLNDVTSGTNSAGEFDTSNNPVIIAGYNAGGGWDATTGLGTPIANQLVPMLIQFDSRGDGVAAITGSKHG